MNHRKNPYDSVYSKYIKRMIDLPLAIFLLFFLIPFLIMISAAIIVDSGLPVFYKGERGGYHGKTFRIYKFRTMVKNADKMGGGTSALHDSRITKIGSFLRKTKLDEIPQLINIITGEMSFVGPRPELLCYTSKYNEDEKVILQVRPGITDYSSLTFINLDVLVGEKNADEIYEKKILPHKNQLRIKYARNISFHTDCKLMYLTGYRVIHKAIKYILFHEEI